MLDPNITSFFMFVKMRSGVQRCTLVSETHHTHSVHSTLAQQTDTSIVLEKRRVTLTQMHSRWQKKMPT